MSTDNLSIQLEQSMLSYSVKWIVNNKQLNKLIRDYSVANIAHTNNIL